jgi:mono/diheme cytochrome c family protein
MTPISAPTALIAAALTAALAASALAAPIRYTPPPETAELAPAPGRELVQSRCGGCHSADYITTQPRSFANARAVWAAEVAKMRKVYGAYVPEEEAPRIVDYLVATYGR